MLCLFFLNDPMKHALPKMPRGWRLNVDHFQKDDDKCFDSEGDHCIDMRFQTTPFFYIWIYLVWLVVPKNSISIEVVLESQGVDKYVRDSIYKLINIYMLCLIYIYISIVCCVVPTTNRRHEKKHPFHPNPKNPTFQKQLWVDRIPQFQVIYSNPVAMRATPKATGRLVGQLHPGPPWGMRDGITTPPTCDVIQWKTLQGMRIRDLCPTYPWWF